MNMISDSNLYTSSGQRMARAGAHTAGRGQAMVSVTQPVLLKKCHLIDVQVLLGEQPGNSLRLLLR